jgi:4-hydroxythreonine-4-phosphate dehydrogenase
MLHPTIAISTGDPAGIGPEVVVKALGDPEIAGLARWLVVGDEVILRQAADSAGADLAKGDHLQVVAYRALGNPKKLTPGVLSAECGHAALEYVRTATQLCLKNEADAVTLSGQKFSGHTEFIAELCGASESRMLLVSERLRVVHVTTHVSLRRACDLSFQRVLRTLELGHEAARLLGFDEPRIAVCGLNPHAGENGLFGEEDATVIAPAIRFAQEQGILCEGPVPADTIFFKAVRGAYDLVVAMYHDQGHIPMKLIDFEHTVNVSLGLPIIRTSVDHGTAFDIAGKNLADPTSMKAALRLAVKMALRRRGKIATQRSSFRNS